jgi:hypothetical protein
VVIIETGDDCTYIVGALDSIVRNGEASKINDAIDIELYRHAGASLLDAGRPEGRTDAVNASVNEEEDEDDDGHNPDQPPTAGGQCVLDAVLVNLPRLQQEGSVVTAMKPSKVDCRPRNVILSVHPRAASTCMRPECRICFQFSWRKLPTKSDSELWKVLILSLLKVTYLRHCMHYC